MSSRSSARICITFKPAQRSALGRMSQESGAPLSELVRRAVDSFVAGRVAGHDHGLDRFEFSQDKSASISESTPSIMP
jgi:hypothetical protein